MNTLMWVAAAVFLALSVADVVLSLRLQRLGAIERNPLLGKYPSPRKLIAFGSITTALWLGAAIWLALKGAPMIEAVFALGIFLRAWVVSKGWKLRKTLEGRRVSHR